MVKKLNINKPGKVDPKDKSTKPLSVFDSGSKTPNSTFSNFKQESD